MILKNLNFVLLFDISDEVFESVEFDFINQLHLLTQSTFWKALILVPNQVKFRQVDEVFVFVFPKRHLGVSQLDELFIFCFHSEYEWFIGLLSY